LTESKKPSPSFAGSRFGALPMMMSPVADSVIDPAAAPAGRGAAGSTPAGAAARLCQRGAGRDPGWRARRRRRHAGQRARHDRDGEDGRPNRPGGGGWEFIDGDDTVGGNADDRRTAVAIRATIKPAGRTGYAADLDQGVPPDSPACA
jgi:hypothetical protein